MNNPEYILVDVFGEIVTAVKQELGFAELNYQYGYVQELNQTLQQWNQTPEFASKRFPLVWLAQPFTVRRGDTPGFYGKTQGLSLFIVHHSTATMTAPERMEQTFKPILYPIYRSLLQKISDHLAFSAPWLNEIPHRLTDRYYWGEQQQTVLNDIVDCLIVSDLELFVNHNENCLPFKSF